ncbi:hypothetical protein OG858_46945 (plasmid) [Streptomyces europaeiscabiei]|uniref:hypothetical protein n=1 Tax=Streptomyces europaeiscabiei TaxID=146819 RepID=UPI002E820177|nr:hypothetical protein [Streptomyces europaeiscabiei]WUD38847.1 hypothetical protein OG858_46945 [Streptomyces europaeiscabiei]
MHNEPTPNEHADDEPTGEELLTSGDYLSGDDVHAPAIPRIAGIPGPCRAEPGDNWNPDAARRFPRQPGPDH